MAKSAHNFYTLSDIRKRGFDPLDFRMLVLQSHYRSATNFSWENLTAAQNRRRNWRNIAELRWQLPDDSEVDNDNLRDEISQTILIAKNRLLHDLSTPNALSTIDEVLGLVGTKSLPKLQIENLIDFIDENLGLNIKDTTPNITLEQENLIEQRTEARANKNWQESDKLRDQLLEQGIELNDTASQTIWSRK